MIGLLINNNGQQLDLSGTVQEVDWSGRKFQAPRQLKVTLRGDSLYGELIQVASGSPVTFSWKKKQLFRGYVFRYEVNEQGIVTMIAYDQMYYLINNSDTYTFENQKASAILTRICKDFSLKIGSVADTGYVIKSLVQEERPLYDIVLRALDTTFKQNGQRFYLFDQGGKVQLIKRSQPAEMWVIETGGNITHYSYSTSIEEAANRVKYVRTIEEEKRIVVVEENKDLQKKWGVLQHYESVVDDINEAQIRTRAKTMLKKMAQEKRSFELTALGIPDIISGGAVQINVEDLGIKSRFYVDQDAHFFKGNYHSMDLTLTYTDELPEVGF
ncbi:XkdQ/YqbQ family protein [Aureibacillus halotolerans]|uniref:YqbQ/XkdQ domain-containing protein n=1 Tax=Aureibacillus halotolerans TaxID=1508390 RepID=A0A4V3D4D9_9BACI|nr:phage portal protein [Aureibacillus halotolerans]TDQ35288.1 hypothetical protein EV213_12275 [Aureibacillus halotolerans]